MRLDARITQVHRAEAGAAGGDEKQLALQRQFERVERDWWREQQYGAA